MKSNERETKVDARIEKCVRCFNETLSNVLAEGIFTNEGAIRKQLPLLEVDFLSFHFFFFFD